MTAEQTCRVGRFLARLYDLVLGMGWRWDDERQVWLDAGERRPGGVQEEGGRGAATAPVQFECCA